MNIQYEKTRALGRMFRGDDSDSDSGGGWGNYGGGGWGSGGYTTGSSTNNGASDGNNGGYSGGWDGGLRNTLGDQPGDFPTGPEGSWSQSFAGQMGDLANIPGFSTFGKVAGLAAPGLGLAMAAINKFGDKDGGWSFNPNAASGGLQGGGMSYGGNGGVGNAMAATGITPNGRQAQTQQAASGDMFADLFSMFGGGQPTTGSPDQGGYEMPSVNMDPYGIMPQLSAGYGGYNQRFNTNYDALQTEVSRFNNPEFQAQQRAMAMADVQQQADAAQQQQIRALTRVGINPNSGRFAAMSSQQAMQTALGKVKAAAGSDAALRSAYISGLGGLNTANDGFAKASQGWGGMATDMAKNNMALALGQGELGLKNRAETNGTALNWANLGAKVYGIDKGIDQTSMQINAKKDSDTKGALAYVMGSWL